MASLTDASGNRTLFAYDLKGRLVAETDPLGKAKTYTYDEDGNVLTTTNRRGQTIEYVYDQAKRLVRKATPERTISYGYNLVDQLTSIGSIYLWYDLAGRLSTYHDTSASFQFSYDAAGNLTGVSDNLSYPPQSRAYAHDALNRVIRLTAAGSEIFQFTYDAVGKRGTLAYPNGMVASYTYSARGELRDLEYVKDGQGLSRFRYEYDAVGRRTALTDSYGRHEFAYDEAGQVTAARWQQMGKERFGYDASGNMLFNREYDFTYGAGNRLLSYACDNVRFTYDDDGNVSSKSTPEGTTQYQWDSENRLIGITKPDGTVIAYQYDELGRRIGKTVGPQQWRWSYLGQEIHRESSWSGLRFYTHGTGIDEHLSMGSNYYVADGLGSIRQIVGAGGNLLNQYRYTAFGKMKQVQAAVGNTYAFTGREWDADAGLYYYRARWYDPDVGRFMSEDPIGLKGGINLSIYVKNNPVAASDPLGLWSYKGYCRYISGGEIVGAACLRCEVWTRCRNDKSKEVGEIVAMFGGLTGGFVAAGVTYFNIELERFPFSTYPTLKDLEGSAEIRTTSSAVGPGYAYTYLRLGLAESEGGDWQAGVDASIDVFWGHSSLKRSETWCCYGD